MSITRRLVTTYGLDAALRHGVLVRATWEVQDDEDPMTAKLITYGIRAEWTQRNATELTPRRIAQLGQLIATGVDKEDQYPRIGIDWDFAMVFMRGQAHATARVAFLMGYLYNELIDAKTIPVFITPTELRHRLDLPAKAEKELTWTRLPLPRTQPKGITKKAFSDVQDALILSYLVGIVPLPKVGR